VALPSGSLTRFEHRRQQEKDDAGSWGQKNNEPALHCPELGVRTSVLSTPQIIPTQHHEQHQDERHQEQRSCKSVRRQHRTRLPLDSCFFLVEHEKLTILEPLHIFTDEVVLKVLVVNWHGNAGENNHDANTQQSAMGITTVASKRDGLRNSQRNNQLPQLKR